MAPDALAPSRGERTGLATIAAEINRHHAECQRAADSAIEHARQTGELLAEAKAQVQHGEWLPWLDVNFNGSRRTASGYMRIARELPKNASLADLGIEGALKQLASSHPDQDPVDEEHEVEPPAGLDDLGEAKFYLEKAERLTRDEAETFLAVADDTDRPEIAGPARRYGHLLLAAPEPWELTEAKADALAALKEALDQALACGPEPRSEKA